MKRRLWLTFTHNPAVRRVLYVTMMYISVYPIAMSVRSTNVYEERSLGVFAEPDPEDEEEPSGEGRRTKVWGNYLARPRDQNVKHTTYMHMRTQIRNDFLRNGNLSEDQSRSSWPR